MNTLETRIYFVNTNLSKPNFNYLDKESFMKEAEKQGSVYTLESFEENFNNNPSADLIYIRQELPAFIAKMDWVLLAKQKLGLLNLTETVTDDSELTGILHIIDSVQDAAVDIYGIDKETVFPQLEATAYLGISEAIDYIEEKGYYVEYLPNEQYMISVGDEDLIDYNLDKGELIKIARSMQQPVKATKLGKSIVHKMASSLNKMIETENLSDKVVQWIGNDLDCINVKYYGEQPDGTNEERIMVNGDDKMTDAEAIDLLSVRLKNTLASL